MHSRRAVKAYDGLKGVLTILPDGTRTIEIDEDNFPQCAPVVLRCPDLGTDDVSLE